MTDGLKLVIADSLDKARRTIDFMGLGAEWTPRSYGGACTGARVAKAVLLRPDGGYSFQHLRWLKNNLDTKFAPGKREIIAL